jgi:hypothetical protein
MKFLVTNDEGLPSAFYADDIEYPDGVPPDAVPISDDQWREFINNAGRRRWQDGAVVDYDPPSSHPGTSEQETLSDWRIGLIKNGRFVDVQARVAAARDSGAEIGLIAWERFEYANYVYRSELMALKDVFGFSASEVDQSMNWARRLREPSTD